MDIRLKWCLLFLTILSPSIADAQTEAKSASKASKVRRSTDAATQPETDLYSGNVDINDICSCSYSNGRDRNIRRNVEKIIRILVQDNLDTKLESLTESDFDVNKHIQETTDKFILQLRLFSKHIANDINSALREKVFIHNINRRQAAMESVLLNYITNSQIPQNNGITEINDLADRITSLTTNTKQLTDAISSANRKQNESMRVINNRLLLLENVTKLEEGNIQNLLNIAKEIQKSVKNTEKELEVFINNSTESETGESAINALCDVKVPKSIVINNDAWRENQIPLKDNLDSYLAMTTGCSYMGIEYNKIYHLSGTPDTFNGVEYEWRLAVRTQTGADLGVWWPAVGYSIFFGMDDNKTSKLRQWEPEKFWEQSTPGILSPDRYVPLHIRISNGTLKIGYGCEYQQLFTLEANVEQGQYVKKLFNSWSKYGAKFLYDCPAQYYSGPGG